MSLCTHFIGESKKSNNTKWKILSVGEDLDCHYSLDIVGGGKLV